MIKIYHFSYQVDRVGSGSNDFVPRSTPAIDPALCWQNSSQSFARVANIRGPELSLNQAYWLLIDALLWWDTRKWCIVGSSLGGWEYRQEMFVVLLYGGPLWEQPIRATVGYEIERTGSGIGLPVVCFPAPRFPKPGDLFTPYRNSDSAYMLEEAPYWDARRETAQFRWLWTTPWQNTPISCGQELDRDR